MVDTCQNCFGPVFQDEPFQAQVVDDPERYAATLEYYYHIECPNLVLETITREDLDS